MQPPSGTINTCRKVCLSIYFGNSLLSWFFEEQSWKRIYCVNVDRGSLDEVGYFQRFSKPENFNWSKEYLVLILCEISTIFTGPTKFWAIMTLAVGSFMYAWLCYLDCFCFHVLGIRVVDQYGVRRRVTVGDSQWGCRCSEGPL